MAPWALPRATATFTSVSGAVWLRRNERLPYLLSTRRIAAMPEFLNHEPEVLTFHFEDDGIIPNNPNLPLVVLGEAVKAGVADRVTCIEQLFRLNGWAGTWKGIVFTYHHYHSNAHEVLGCYFGSATIQFGGEKGEILEIEAGDVAILPAGTGHKRLRSSGDFGVVGGYPRGQESYDMRTGESGERPLVIENIRHLSLPDVDPISGPEGPLMEAWNLAGAKGL